MANHRGGYGQEAGQRNEQPRELNEQPRDLRGETTQQSHGPDQGTDARLPLGHALHHGASLSRYSSVMLENDLRTRLQRRLGARFTAALWNYLLERGFVEDVLVGASDLDQLADEAQRILTAAAPSDEYRVPAPAPREPKLGQERAWALSQLVAEHARYDPDVVAFRRKYLGDALVEWADLETWIAARAELDGEPTTDITVAVPAGAATWLRDADELDISPPLGRARPSRVGPRLLDYALPGDEWVHRAAVTADGTLDRLRGLAEALANAYGWIPAQATIFVLCGVTPFIATVRVTRSAAKVRHHADLVWARRITLDIDPAATPQEVVDAFQWARRRQGLAHLRPLTLKHIRLAAFADAEHSHKPWAERMRLWNTRFPEWHYTGQSNFRRDAIRAAARILYPGRYRGSTPLRERHQNELIKGG
jgi:hypothetical protein